MPDVSAVNGYVVNKRIVIRAAQPCVFAGGSVNPRAVQPERMNGVVRQHQPDTNTEHRDVDSNTKRKNAIVHSLPLLGGFQHPDIPRLIELRISVTLQPCVRVVSFASFAVFGPPMQADVLNGIDNSLEYTHSAIVGYGNIKKWWLELRHPHLLEPHTFEVRAERHTTGGAEDIGTDAVCKRFRPLRHPTVSAATAARRDAARDFPRGFNRRGGCRRI